jgi:hypothetical protein
MCIVIKKSKKNQRLLEKFIKIKNISPKSSNIRENTA